MKFSLLRTRSLDEAARHKRAKLVLENPVFVEMTEPIRKMRFQLMAVSSIAIFSSWMGISISENQTIFGVTFTGLTTGKIAVIFLIVTLYMLIHFVWNCWDSFLEWAMRSSGTAIAFPVGHKERVSNDPRQLSLMSWWRAMVESAGDAQKDAADAKGRLEAAIQFTGPPPPGMTNISAMMSTYNSYAAAMVHLYKYGVSSANESTLREGLEKFECLFKHFLRSQNRRWIWIEFALPVVLALGAILMLLTELDLNPFYRLSVI